MNWLAVSSFCESKLLLECLHHLSKTNLPKDLKIIIIDNHYPINKTENRIQIRRIAELFDCIYIESGRDLGLHEGLNNAFKIINPKDNDVWLGVDPDDRPDEFFAQRLIQSIQCWPDLAVIGTRFKELEPHIIDLKGKEIRTALCTISGIHSRVWIHHFAEMWNVAAFSVPFLRKCGGFKEPFKYYGGLESSLYQEWTRLGMKLGYELNSFTAYANKNDPTLVNPLYAQWKTQQITGKFTESFEEFLIANGQAHLIK